MKKSKYNNKRKKIDGHSFDSLKEADFYLKLCCLEKAGEVLWFEVQFPLHISLHIKRLKRTQRSQIEEIIGSKYSDTEDTSFVQKFASLESESRNKVYRADFLVFWKDGRVEIIDTKGFKTELYKFKKHLVEILFPFKIVEI
jgi:hypothetical protein